MNFLRRLRRSMKPLLGVLNQALRPLGLRLVRTSQPPRSYAEFFRAATRAGFDPGVVVDVGIGLGTPDIYEAFPHARYYLVEPHPGLRPVLEGLARTLRATVVEAAAGEESGRATLHLPEDPECASLAWAASGDQARSVTVDVVRLDDVVAEEPGGDLLIKLDIQGHELPALRGARRLLQGGRAMVVVECTLIVAPGGDSLLDVLQAMDGFGYAVFDVLGGGYRPLDGALGQLDVVFLPKAHRLRRDLRWSAS